MIKAVLLDLDDTILDFHRAESAALARTLSESGIEPSSETIALYSGINRRLWQMLEVGEIDRKSLLSRRFEILFERLGQAGNPAETQKKYENYLSMGHYFMPHAEELLETLHGQYALYLVSNGNARVQEGRLASAGIAKYFKEMFISEHIGWDKPSPVFFDRCFARMEGIERSASIIVGDSLSSDIRGGLNAGIHTCWYNPGGAPAGQGICPEFEIRSLLEIPALLEKL